jgi:hypothetical protein
LLSVSVTPTFTGNPVIPTASAALSNGDSNAVTTGTHPGGGAAAAGNAFSAASINVTVNPITPSGTISAVSFGSGNSHPIIPNAVIVNKIIFAGR